MGGEQKQEFQLKQRKREVMTQIRAAKSESSLREVQIETRTKSYEYRVERQDDDEADFICHVVGS